jgi:hypothetical protein
VLRGRETRKRSRLMYPWLRNHVKCPTLVRNWRRSGLVPAPPHLWTQIGKKISTQI